MKFFNVFFRRINKGIYSQFKKDGDGSARGTPAMEDRAEMEEELLIGRESRASVDKSLERVRMSIQREFDDRKLEMMEVSQTPTNELIGKIL